MHKEHDYFIPILAPYVQWVRAYRQLISSLYEEKKTVRRTWKAFIAAVPGVEQRLEFDVFEQILLFSLFLSEWDDTEGVAVSAEAAAQAAQGKIGAADYPRKHDDDLDVLTLKLREAIEQRDRALSNLAHHEQKAQKLEDQKAYLERQVGTLEKNLEMLQNDLQDANKRLGQRIHEIEIYRAENAGLREKSSVLNDKSASFEQHIEDPQKDHVIKQDSGQAIFPKKVGRWNMQRSKDGYYRLYRKIGGKVHSIYIGKEFNIEKAETRIADRERELPVTNPTASSRSAQMKMEAPRR